MSIITDRALRSPLVTILDLDFNPLDELASAGKTAGIAAAEFLATELDRAVIRPANEIGPNVVRMNSRVAFRIDGRHDVQVRTLVYPDEYARRTDRSDCVSVLAPVGAALLGLQVGTGMRYEAANGAKQYVGVVAILQQAALSGYDVTTGKGDDGAANPAFDNDRSSNGHDSGPTAA